MSDAVDVSFECLPLRSVTRLDPPLDASPAYRAFVERVKSAIDRHGVLNSYYLHDARCRFHLTNRDGLGELEFRFEGVVLTDASDTQVSGSDLSIELVRETCDWLSNPIVEWFHDSVRKAVAVEFELFAAAGDLSKTEARLRKLAEESESSGGYIGMGL